jgi:prepilin-type processing-associated H-X9-DG protein
MFRFRHFENGPRTNDGIMNMAYLDCHVKGWKWATDSEIYPTGGNGLWTTQRGFYWWDSTQGLMERYLSPTSTPPLPYF